MDETKIKQFDIKTFNPDGSSISFSVYVNIETNQVIDASQVVGLTIEKVNIDCAEICSTS